MKELNSKNVEINGTSPIEDILTAIDGIWCVTEINGWRKICLGNRLTIYRKILSSGKNVLPKTFNGVNVCRLYNDDDTVGCKIIHDGDQAIEVSNECFGEIIEV